MSILGKVLTHDKRVKRRPTFRNTRNETILQQLTMNTRSLLGLLIGLLVSHVVAQDFLDTCDEIQVLIPAVRANCQTPPMGPPWICSELDLNNCLGNSGGSLVAQEG